MSDIGGESDGYNLYAYCFNNPVNFMDPTGYWPQWIKDAVSWVNNNIIQPVIEFVEDLKEDYDNYDTNNQSEDVVFSSNYFSNYKGVPVVKTPFDSSFSFGMIGLSRTQQTPDHLNHEYGHALQLENKGHWGYLVDVAVPSATLNVLNRQGKLPYDYFSYPWEAEANELGGSMLSQQGKPRLPAGGYTSYYDLLKLFNE